MNDADGVVGRLAAFLRGQHSRGNSDGGADEERDDGEFERGGIVRKDYVRDRLLKAE